MYILEASGGARETADFIRRSGGRVTQEQLDQFESARLAPVRERNAKEQLAHSKWSEAGKIEKSDPARSIALYREGIGSRST